MTITKERFMGEYIRWMRDEITVMRDHNLNFPLALCTLAYIEFLGSIFTGPKGQDRKNAEIYIKECFGEHANEYPIEILWDVFRNGLAHDYFTRGGVSKEEVRPAIQTSIDGVKILYVKTLANDFLRSLEAFEDKITYEQISSRIHSIYKKSEDLTKKHEQYELVIRPYIANIYSSVLAGIDLSHSIKSKIELH